MVVQVNGKVRDRIEVDPGIDEAEAERLALASEKVQADIDGATPQKVIARPPQPGQHRRFVRIALASGAAVSSDCVVKGPYRSDARCSESAFDLRK